MNKIIKDIEVNNGQHLLITDDRDGITMVSDNRKYYFTDGEIVMACNLLRYMLDEDMKSVYLFNPLRNMENYLHSLLLTGDIEEFQIFQ